MNQVPKMLLRAILGAALAATVHQVACGQDRARAPGLGLTRDFEVQAPGGDLFALAVHDDGTGPQLYVGGEFYYIMGHLPFSSLNIARWNGTTWSNVQFGVSWEATDQFAEYGVLAMGSFGSGLGSSLFVGGYFTRYYSQQAQAVLPTNGFVRWDGTDFTDASA
ncbi:MAG: hypothetical protein NTY35_03095 [Planctomycetota bacterium]|nr:hypothetical protein [Planctomycetota bacterium]